MSDNPNGCTNAEMEEFVEKARPIIVQQYPTADHLNESTDSGIVSYMFQILDRGLEIVDECRLLKN